MVDPGRLSPTRLLINVSISWRLSGRPGVGETSYNCQRDADMMQLAGKPYLSRTLTQATRPNLVGAELSLPLKLCKLSLLRENLISTLLHFAESIYPSQELLCRSPSLSRSGRIRWWKELLGGFHAGL